MKHCVQFSTGLASAEIARRLVAEHGPQNIILLTADTCVEDPDNWRFAYEVHQAIGRPTWFVLSDGRTPMQAGRDARCVPNDRMAVCSRVLKRELLREWINAHCDPAATLIYEGYDWTEMDRIELARPRWAPFTLCTPLAEPPYTSKPDLLATFDDLDIRPPRLYSYGFPHANCGGACVRGGQAQWELLLRVFPERYRQWEADEEETRAMLGKNVTIMSEQVRREVRPLTLRRFRERLEAQPGLFDCDDWGACGCA